MEYFKFYKQNIYYTGRINSPQTEVAFVFVCLYRFLFCFLSGLVTTVGDYLLQLLDSGGSPIAVSSLLVAIVTWLICTCEVRFQFSNFVEVVNQLHFSSQICYGINYYSPTPKLLKEVYLLN